jgi:hypothetical protein
MRCCVICADAIQNDVVTLACGHCFDVNCLNDLFQAATRDESLYPPQCCFVPIPFDTAKTHLPSSTTSAYLDKEVEYKTHRRVYCAAPTCSRFIGSRDPDGTTPTIRACPSSGCKTRTCGRCTSGVLEGQRHACKVDRGERHALAVGRNHGWVRCPGCEEMVERSCGCFHMTCRCRTQFCYICRSIWKTCSCTRWTARVAAVRRQPMLVCHFINRSSSCMLKGSQRLYLPYASCSVRHPCLNSYASIPDGHVALGTLGPPDTTQGLSRHAKCRHTDMTRRYVGRRCQDCNQAFVLGYVSHKYPASLQYDIDPKSHLQHCPDCQTSVCSDCKLKLP